MRKGILIVIISCVYIFNATAQPIVLEGMVQAGELTCYPTYGDNKTFKFLPSEAGLTIVNGLPEFSFLQYAIENKDSEISSSSITDAFGGGLINFLVTYTTPEKKIKKAEKELQKLYQSDSIKLVGPVEITTGQFMLVSSVLLDGKEERTLIGTGRAPVFQNSKVAFSFMLTREKSTLLMESFKMQTPDISIVFDLGFRGLTKAFNGRVSVDWGMVSESKFSKENVDLVFFSSDTENVFQNLNQSGAIKMETYGQDSLAGELLDRAYDKLLKLMFEPIEPDSLNKPEEKSWMEKTFGYSNDTRLAQNIYKSRTIKKSGKTIIEMNTQDLVDRYHLVTFNIGNLYEDYKDNKSIFRKVALDNELFKQREVTVTVDGNLKADFDKMVNSVSVTMRKKHTNGEETIKEIFIDATKLEKYEGPIKLTYMNKEDMDKTLWLDYEYKVNWQFKRDGNYQTDWITSNSPIVNLYAPYKFHQVDLMGDISKLKSDDIIAVIAQVDYPFFGRNKSDKQIIKPFNDQNESNLMTILPSDVDKVDYTITWIYRDGKKVTKSGVDDLGILLIDELPIIE